MSDNLDRNLKKDIKHFDSQLNKYLGIGLSKDEKAVVYAEFGRLKKLNAN